MCVSSLCVFFLVDFSFFFSFFFNDTATTEIYTFSLHDALPISGRIDGEKVEFRAGIDGAEHGCSSRRRNLYSRSEEHTSELQSLTNLVCRLLLEKKKHNCQTRLVIEGQGVYGQRPSRHGADSGQ